MDPDPALSFIFLLMSSGLLTSVALLILLILASGLISGSEVAFYSLNHSDLQTLEEEESKAAKRILTLKKEPRSLLATILISNNFINISIVILSTFIVEEVLGVSRLMSVGNWLYDLGLGSLMSANHIASLFNFLVTVVGITSVLVLFGEIAPKVYANLNNLRFARFMSMPLSVLKIILRPISSILVSWSNKLESRITSSSGYQSSTSKEDIDTAIELTVSNEEDSDDEQVDILKGIVKFGDVTVKQVMKSRVDVTSFDITTGYKEVLDTIKELGYSRIPVHTEDFDNVVGILYVKDLLGNTDKSDAFEWQELIRTGVLYVPESKKINDVLKEFQAKRTHMAVVVDEFGGSAGIITLEDVMEEIIGDIKDEFDEDEEVEYVELSPGKYIFEGKSMLNDVCRIIGLDTNYFDKVKGESDSLAGLILEVAGHIPKKEQEIEHRDVSLKIVSVSKRRIEKIALSIDV